jgi:hypothetical protein
MLGKEVMTMVNIDATAVSVLEEETGLDLSWGEASYEEENSSMTVRGYVTDNIYVATYVCWIVDGESCDNITSAELLELIHQQKSA